MPVLIGAKPESTFEDPIGLLGDCHRRIERFLSILVRVTAEVCGNPLSDEQRTAFETALKYFREAAPKHSADEEESLFPRLRGMKLPELQALHSKLDQLEEDHACAEKAHDEVERLGGLWLEAGSLTPEQASLLSSLLEEVSELYRGHIAVEEGEVFPLAEAVLSAPERKAIGMEMALRRGLKPAL